MRTLFLAWQTPSDRAWFPVGRLDADTEHSRYRFSYTGGALTAEREGFRPMVSFPRIHECYESSDLFPMFKNRVLAHQRRDFTGYLASLALERPDPIEILAVTGGARQTDSFEVFPKMEKQADNSFSCRFFLHGLRYMSTTAQERAFRLQPEEALGVSLELNNPRYGLALQLTSQDYEFIGWTPRYIVGDLLQAITQTPQVAARVVRVNPDDVPANRRVLVEMHGFLPANFEPMASGDFLSIGCVDARQ